MTVTAFSYPDTGALSLRPSNYFLAFTAMNLLLFSLLLLHARTKPAEALAIQSSCAELVEELLLTDLCLFTEARYTRNPAMADLHSPFQDHPLSLEHFPSGALVMPPAVIKRDHEPAR
jgi:hypothetical protein